MKILALEKSENSVDWSQVQQILQKEAFDVYQLYLKGTLREIYFNEKHSAVLILECNDKNEAFEILNTLPLVEKNLISFEIMELKPYRGYERLIKRIII